MKTRIVQEDIPREFRAAVERLRAVSRARGFVIYAVGGWVRDIILGRDSKDLDIMVEGEQGGIRFAQAVARDCGLGPPVIFPRFGTARLGLEGMEIEFVMPRREYYDPGSRNPETAQGTLQQDALRRDFTINALFLRLNDFTLLDLTGRGMADIAAGVIRVTDPSAADAIFSQDPLRMLRAVRQELQLGFGIEQLTGEAIARNAARLEIVSRERVRDELEKILACPLPGSALCRLNEYGLWPQILPQLGQVSCDAGSGFVRACAAIDSLPAGSEARVAALLCSAPEYSSRGIDALLSWAEPVLRRLCFSAHAARSVGLLLGRAKAAMRYEPSWTDGAVRCFIRDSAGLSVGACALALALARSGQGAVDESLIAELAERVGMLNKDGAVDGLRLPFAGDELIALLGRPAGPWLGLLISRLSDCLMEDPSLSKEELLALARGFSAGLPDTPR